MSTTFSNARKCLRCGWEWVIRLDGRGRCSICNTTHSSPQDHAYHPKQCPRCRTEKWNQEQEPERA